MTGNTFHFHVEEIGRDCDGGHEREMVMEEFAGETGRLAWNAYVAYVIKFFGYSNPQPGQTLRRYTAEDGTDILEYGGPTDEGFHHERVASCNDEFCLSPNYRTHYRDEYAEAAGY